MIWLAWLLAANVLVVRWFYVWGIAKGRLLERREVLKAASEPERHLYVVRGERWHDDGPGAA